MGGSCGREVFEPTEYEKKTYPMRGGAFVSEREISDILELSEDAPSPLTLEVGMGPGRMTKRLAERKSAVVGLDADPRMLRYFADKLRATNGSGGGEIFLVAAAGEWLPFRNGVFGEVVCVRVLRYFDKPRRAIADMCRVLVPRGVLVLEFANILRADTVLQMPNRILKGEFYPRLFARKRIEEWVSGEGMLVEDVRGWHKVPVSILTLTNNKTVLNALFSLESILQQIAPPDLLSRSMVMRAVKTRTVTITGLQPRQTQRTAVLAWATPGLKLISELRPICPAVLSPLRRRSLAGRRLN